MLVNFLVSRVDVQAMDRIRPVSSATLASKESASDDPVDEAPLLRHGCVDDVGGQRESFGAAEASMPRDSPHADARNDAFSHCRDPEPRIVARDAQVAGEGNLEAAADAVRVNRRDDDRVERFQLAKRRFPVSEEGHAGLALGQRGDVDAAAERAARAADDDDADVFAGPQGRRPACPDRVPTARSRSSGRAGG